MQRRKIVAVFDDHDYEQLELLAKMNKVKLADLMRKIVKAYLDGRKAEQR
jgi:hypothetical protein